MPVKGCNAFSTARKYKYREMISCALSLSLSLHTSQSDTVAGKRGILGQALSRKAAAHSILQENLPLLQGWTQICSNTCQDIHTDSCGEISPFFSLVTPISTETHFYSNVKKSRFRSLFSKNLHFPPQHSQTIQLLGILQNRVYLKYFNIFRSKDQSLSVPFLPNKRLNKQCSLSQPHEYFRGIYEKEQPILKLSVPGL